MDLAKSSILKNRSLGKENNDKGRVIDGSWVFRGGGVGRDTSAYTNTVERNWTLKENALQYGRRKHHLEDYLAKVAFQMQHPEADRQMHPSLLAAVQLSPPGH